MTTSIHDAAVYGENATVPSNAILDLTYTVTTGAKKMIISVGLSENHTISSVTWDYGGTAQPASVAISQVDDGPANYGYLLYIDNPTVGSSLTLRVVANTTCGINAGVYTLEGTVDSGAPTYTNTNVGDGTVSVSTTGDSLGWTAGMCTSQNLIPTDTGSQTHIFNNEANWTGFTNTDIDSDYFATDGSVTFQWTLNNGVAIAATWTGTEEVATTAIPSTAMIL